MFLRCHYERAVDGTFKYVVRHCAFEHELTDKKAGSCLNFHLLGLANVTGNDRADNVRCATMCESGTVEIDIASGGLNCRFRAGRFRNRVLFCEEGVGKAPELVLRAGAHCSGSHHTRVLVHLQRQVQVREPSAPSGDVIATYVGQGGVVPHLAVRALEVADHDDPDGSLWIALVATGFELLGEYRIGQSVGGRLCRFRRTSIFIGIATERGKDEQGSADCEVQ